MRFKWLRFSRKTHYWSALTCALPVLLIVITGVLLLLKKDIEWLQPPSQQGQASIPTVQFAAIFDAVNAVEQAEINSWQDIHRLDVRPSKGIIKVRANSGWEIQLDASSAEVLQVAYRRTDLIESLHDGSFFHGSAKYWLALPAGFLLLLLCISGGHMAIRRLQAERNNSRLKRQMLEKRAIKLNK